MQLLLDTHVFLWALSSQEKLSPAAKEAFAYAEELYLSSISAWEIQVKYQLGKLDLVSPPVYHIPELRHKYNIQSLPFEEQDAFQLAKLPHS